MNPVKVEATEVHPVVLPLLHEEQAQLSLLTAIPSGVALKQKKSFVSVIAR
jgi:hypothetical protein